MSEIETNVSYEGASSVEDRTPAPGSVGDWLSARRAQLVAHKEYELSVPGFGGRLVGVYSRPDYRTIRRVAELQEGGGEQWKREVIGFADILVRTCKRVYAKNEAGEQVTLGGGWSIDVCRVLGIDDPEITKATQAVLAVFQGAEMLLAEHVADLMQRVQADDPAVERELGEDSAPTGASA